MFEAMQRAIMKLNLIPLHKKGTIFALVFLFCFSFLLVAGSIVLAAPDPNNPAADNYGLDTSAPPALQTATAKEALPSRVGTIVGIALSFVGVLFLILIIYAGIMWMTAAGNDQQVAKAKEIIIAAVIGLVIVLSAYGITMFIGTQL